MKKYKAVFTVLIIVTLLFGLWLKSGSGKKYEETQFLLDTVCSITAYGADARNAVDDAFERISEVHALTNFYDKDSDVSRINRAAAGEEVEVDGAVIEILTAAEKISEETHGAYDVTVAAVSELWDFKAEKPKLPEAAEIDAALERIDYKALTIDVGKGTVTKKTDGVMVDLGSAAKGYAADEAQRVLERYEVDGAIIDLGGNIVCLGENPGTKNKKWRIGLQKPFEATGEYKEIVECDQGAVVTSGTYQRFFELDGKRYHHILDVSTGYPKESPYSSVTVAADSALTADLLSTACFLVGIDSGKELARAYGAEVYYQE